jgi:L-rhamnose isomerase
MNHKPYATSAGTTVPACLAHEPEATGFTLAATDAEVDCPLCLSHRKARRYFREFAQRHTGPKAPATRVTECGSAMVVR